MREWIRGLSFRGEFALVILAAFGLALGSTAWLLATSQWWLNGPPPFTNDRLLRTLLFEVIVGGLLWKGLTLRGWTGAKVGLTPLRAWSLEYLTTPLIAIGLLLAFYVAYAVLFVIAANLQSDLISQAIAHGPRVAAGLPLATVVAVALVNPVFEEVFVCGYVISGLRERVGIASAVNVSAGIRLAYHLYQGPVGVLGITPFALITALWFARTRRLAPLILAHGLVDFTGLLFGSQRA
jgi:membrane protease YdiL (CAAX protease family)